MAMTQTDNARRVIKLAKGAALKRGDPEWDREHLLLALCQLGDEPAVRGGNILMRLGFDESRVRAAIDRHRPPRPELDESPPEADGPPNPFPGHMVERVYIHARWLAAHFGQRAADTEHLLLGVLSDEDPQNRIFRDLGVRFEDAYHELASQAPPRELVPPRAVIIPIADFRTALRMLPKVLPTGVSCGHNFDDEYGWFSTSADIDLQCYVERALGQG